MAVALQEGIVAEGDRIGMFGIGSGINCLMLGVQWQRSLVIGDCGEQRRAATAVES
jgi:3-oxoacyl-[acyl-carrier-protein] synthase-3